MQCFEAIYCFALHENELLCNDMHIPEWLIAHLYQMFVSLKLAILKSIKMDSVKLQRFYKS